VLKQLNFASTQESGSAAVLYRRGSAPCPEIPPQQNFAGPVSFCISSSDGASVLRCTGSSNAASLFPKLAYPVVSSLPQHLYRNKLPDRKGSIQKILYSHFQLKIFLKYS